MSQSVSQKYMMPYLNGFAAATILVLTSFLLVVMIFGIRSSAFGFLLLPMAYGFTRFRVVPPNTALVGTRFGEYAGILPKADFVWLLPFYSTISVSLKTSNYVTATLKVNDASGTPIEIAAAIVYHIENPAAAVLDVENAHGFLQVQSEGALRVLATHHPYTNDGSADSLTGHSDKILEQFRRMVQERVEMWGTDSFCTAPIRAELRANPCYINDAADCAYANDDVTFFKKTIKTYQIPSKS